MKTRYFFLLASITGILAASCAKELNVAEEEIIETPVGQTVLTIGLPDQNKTQMGDGGLVYWSNGDQLSLNGTASAELAGLPANSRTATFTWGGIINTPYKLLYPASIYKDASHITLPAVQSYRAGGFAENMFPMAGYSADGSSINVNHLCAIVKISIKRETESEAEARGAEVDTDNIACVRFRGKNSEKVSGEFEIDYITPALADADGTGTDLEVRVAKSLATSTSTATEYYLVVPAREYTNGFEVVVQDVNNHIMTKGKTGAKTLEAGHLYAMKEFAFAPTETELGIEISSDEELVAFAQDYNNNEYEALGSQLMVTVTSDITFDAESSADFNATGGIGIADNYFNGVFNGNDKTISSLDATVPLFAYTGGGGTVKDLTVDNTCSFTYTHPATSEGNFGAIAGYHKGTLDNVKVAADISLAAVENVAQMTSVGGLVGRATTGKIQNDSEYSGLISTPSGFTTASDNKLIIGGLVGRFTNAGSVTDSYFKGAISNEAQVPTSANKSDPYLIIGGIVGYIGGGGSVTSCETTDDHADVGGAGVYSSELGSIVNKTTISNHSAVGGIVGENYQGTVSDCTNGAIVFCTIFRASQTGARYMKTGGIAGRNDANGTITGCTNNGKVSHRSNPRLQAIGGIAGNNAGTISGCTNNAVVANYTSGQSVKAGRQVQLGGIVGENTSSNVSNVHNTGNLEISRVEDGNEIDVCLGGVIGKSSAAINGVSPANITNSGTVLWNTYNTTQLAAANAYNLGGVVGYSSQSVQNVKNTGLVQFNWAGTADMAAQARLGGIVGQVTQAVQNVENTGKVYVNWTGISATSDIQMGGVAGRAGADIRNATNSGYIQFNHTVNKLASDISVGGIAGYISGNGTLKDCLNQTTAAANSGEVYFNIDISGGGGAHQNDCVGGILGSSTSNVTLDNCDNRGYVHTGRYGSANDNNACYLGGVVGYLGGASSIAHCDNTGRTYIDMGNNTDNDLTMILTDGGIAGVVKGTSSNRISISDCTWNYSAGNVGSRRGTCGGIAAYAEYADIDDCDVNVTYNYYNHVIGGIVGWAVQTNISGCRFMGSKITATQGFITGGIVAKLTSGSVVDGCVNYCYDITTPKATTVRGEIAGISESGTTIQNCHHTGTISICSDSNYTDGGGNDSVLPAISRLTVISYNIRYYNTTDGDNSWDNRKPATKAMIETLAPDVFGVQEAYPVQEQYILDNCTDYLAYGVGRDDGVNEGERMTIFWNNTTIEMLQTGTFWLSETPDTPSKGWDAACKRTATWGFFRHRASGQRFFYVNTHLDHKGATARANGLALIRSEIASRNTEGLPMILTGDFNVEPENGLITSFSTEMSDARNCATTTVNQNINTYNGFGSAAGELIDYIFYDGFSACPLFQAHNETFAEVPYISDHYPIRAILVF